MSPLHLFIRDWRFPIRSACLMWTMLIMAASNSAFAQEESEKPKTWEGTWTNRRYNSSGPLKCTAVRKSDETYEARFEGTFMGSPFEYIVPVKVTNGDDRTLLEGDPTIDGDPYEWFGYVRGGVLYGRFRSAKGHNGEFRLRESKEKALGS